MEVTTLAANDAEDTFWLYWRRRPLLLKMGKRENPISGFSIDISQPGKYLTIMLTLNIHEFVPGFVRRKIKQSIENAGYTVTRAPAEPPATEEIDPLIVEFKENAKGILERHRNQSMENMAFLNRKYEQPVFGKILVWDLVERLGMCVDPTDGGLYNTSQYTHVCQVLESMENAGVEDEYLLLAAIIHDLGKLLLLTDEKPENVVCMNSPIGEYEDRVGLDNVAFQWNHDEFVYMRFKNIVPEPVAWLLRYHSIKFVNTRRLFDSRDLELFRKYLKPFRVHDMRSKSPFHIPKIEMGKYQALIHKYFPEPIDF